MTGGDKDRRLTRADHKDGRVVVHCVGGLGTEVPALGLRGRGGVSFGARLGRGGRPSGLVGGAARPVLAGLAEGFGLRAGRVGRCLPCRWSWQAATPLMIVLAEGARLLES